MHDIFFFIVIWHFLLSNILHSIIKKKQRRTKKELFDYKKISYERRVDGAYKLLKFGIHRMSNSSDNEYELRN